MNITIFEHLKEILKETLPSVDLDTVTENSSLKNDLGVDSIEAMMIAILIEEEYGFKFDESLDFDTVGDLCDYIEERIA